MILTRAQRVALKAVFDRAVLVILKDNTTRAAKQNEQYYGLARYATYRQFRRTVVPAAGGYCGENYILVPWCGMWLGIETDGHTHS